MGLETYNDGVRRLFRTALISLTLGVLVLCGCASCAPGGTDASGSSADAGTAGASGASNTTGGADASGASGASGSGEAAPDEALLASIMGEEDAAKLLKGAKDNADRYWIAAHPQLFANDGEAVQEKLLRLAADENDALTYVREFPQRYAFGTNVNDDGFGYPKVQADSATIASKDDSGDAAADDTGYPAIALGNAHVPHLYQWDQRWGYAVYSSSAFGLTGCGPTAMAIAYQGVTGKSDINPYDMGKLAYEMGFMAQFDGTDGAFLEAVAPQLGLECEYIDLTEEGIRDAFERGLIIIDNMGDGHFSHYGGHYLVLTGIDNEGKIVMNDPYSAENSRKTWDADFLLSETVVLYAFAKSDTGAAGKSTGDSPDGEETFDDSAALDDAHDEVGDERPDSAAEIDSGSEFASGPESAADSESGFGSSSAAGSEPGADQISDVDSDSAAGFESTADIEG